jgi:hypothetical protein
MRAPAFCPSLPAVENVKIKINADPLYQHLLIAAEKKFWR